MVDYSKIHEVIAETNEGILLAEYQPEYRTDREYQSEADLERQLLMDLVNGLNYEQYGSSYTCGAFSECKGSN